VSSYSTAEKPLKCQDSFIQPQTVVDLYPQEQCCGNFTFCMILSACQYTMHTASSCCKQVRVISHVKDFIYRNGCAKEISKEIKVRKNKK
jgi:hypothetical protein